MTEPAPPAPEADVRPLPLWAFALLGVLTGLITTCIMEVPWWQKHAGLALGTAAFTWVAALGAALLDRPRQRWAALGLAALTALAVPLTSARLGLDPEGTTAFVVAALALGGAALIAMWTGGRPGGGAVWEERQAGPFLVNSALAFAVAAILGALFLALVRLSGTLADAVGIPQLNRLLDDPWVMLPLLVGGAAFFLGAVRSQGWGQGVTRALAHLLGLLLPVATVITLGFLLLLPLAAMQNTGQLFGGMLSSPLYLTLTGVTLLLTLFAFHVTPSALPARLQAFTRWGAAILPAYPLLALYGLGVRTAQYGLTEARVLALTVTVWLLVSALAVAFTRRVPPFAGLPRAVTISAAAVFSLGFLFSVPGLHPQQLAVRSQLARATAPNVDRQARAAAFSYVAYRAGLVGKTALNRVNPAPLDPATRAMLTDSRTLQIAEFHQKYLRNAPSETPAVTRLVVMPGSAPISAARQAALLRWAQEEGGEPWGPDSLCQMTGPQRCELRAFARPDTREKNVPEQDGAEQQVFIPGNHATGEGRWVTLDAQGLVTGQGSFGRMPQHPARYEEPAFTLDAAPTRVTLDALRLKDGTVILLSTDRNQDGTATP